MTTDLLAESTNNARPDEMARETTLSNEIVLLALPSERLKAPAQTLNDGLVVDVSGEIEQTVPKQDKLAGQSPLVGSQSRQGFRIGELRLMIRYEDASELAEMSIIHRLPNAPDWFCGIANLHGKLTPVFDLARYFCVDPDSRGKRMLLVLSRGSDATGVLIDGMPERLRCLEDSYTEASAPPERLMPHIHGAALVGEQLWFDLDIHSLLGAIEQSLRQSQ